MPFSEKRSATWRNVDASENNLLAKLLASKMKSPTIDFGKVIEKRKTLFKQRTPSV